MSSVLSLFARLGGRPTLERVHRLFYDKLFAHEWASHFFQGVEQTFIEEQQTDFMSSVLGGPKCFVGQFPRSAHRHMYITEELFDLRNELLAESLDEAGVPSQLAAEWLRHDRSFKDAVVKQSIDECEQRYVFEPLLVVEDPRRKPGRRAS